ncbi:hypothetical protein J6590_019870 [Homalodisca vitripennis]|nr:hypothetical protein J6590_019870 [Homalodisca vitripennis]
MGTGKTMNLLQIVLILPPMKRMEKIKEQQREHILERPQMIMRTIRVSFYGATKLPQSRDNFTQQFMLGMNRSSIQHPNIRVHSATNVVPPQQQGMTQLLMNNNNSPQHSNTSLLKPDYKTAMRGQG